jgi:hypothetical protein
MVNGTTSSDHATAVVVLLSRDTFIYQRCLSSHAARLLDTPPWKHMGFRECNYIGRYSSAAAEMTLEMTLAPFWGGDLPDSLRFFRQIEELAGRQGFELGARRFPKLVMARDFWC